ncbi:hypothetical protein PXJ20_30180 [Paraburkholderia sp. A1RI_3L]|uniref:hypothetical protein n=1 Tax=Paraburkholderia TaxID=1822464 RepID=UPI003B7D36E8
MQGDFSDPTPSLPAASDPHQAAIKFRNELLAMGWPDGKRVAEMAGISPDKNSARYAARLRASGALLGIWDVPHRTFRHPDFQFDAHGKVLPEVAQLLKALPGGDDDRSGWRRAFWMYSPHPGLDAENPAHVFKFDAQRVIDVAKREFDRDRNAHW